MVFLINPLQSVSLLGGNTRLLPCYRSLCRAALRVQFSWNKAAEGRSQEHRAHCPCVHMFVWWLQCFCWICLLWDWRWKQVDLSFTEVTAVMLQKWFGFLVLLTWASSGCLSSTFILLSAEIKQVEEEGVGVTREAKGRAPFVQPLKHFDCSLGFFKAAHVE